MKSLFEIAAGSIVGTDHRKPFVWKNNQDALVIRQHGDLTVAVVADGCGSGLYSEFGARLGANILSRRLIQLFGISSCENVGGNIEVEKAWIESQLDVLQASIILSLSSVMSEIQNGSKSQAVNDNFLFTTLALVIGPVSTFVLGIGDGVYAINGDVKVIGPFDKNEPPYLAYGGLVKSHIPPELCRFNIHAALPTSEVMSACIGTDGAGDFERISSMTMPGRKELVGPLSQFWTHDNYFKIPEGLRRRLNLINNSHIVPNWETKELDEEHGRLKDDTTLVVARRIKK